MDKEQINLISNDNSDTSAQRTKRSITQKIAVISVTFCALLASFSLIPLNALAQYEKSDWRVLKTNTDVEFTGAAIFSLATTLFVDNKGYLWDTWDTALTLKAHYLDVIDSRRNPIPALRFSTVVYNTDSSGFICGERGALLQTKDWGRNWKQRYFENLDNLYFYDLAFINKRQGVLVGVTGNDSVSYKGIVYTTSDGGDSWQEIQGLKGIGFSHINHDIETNQLIITAIGSVLISADQGHTWETVLLPEGEIMREAILTSDNGIAVGLKGRILITEDAGKSWKESESPTKANLISVSRYAPGYWYISGEMGEVWKTTDFGKTWTDLGLEIDVVVNGVQRMGPRLFAWGSNGTIAVRGLGTRR